MAKNHDLLMNGTGFAFAGTQELFQMQSLQLTVSLQQIEIALRNGNYNIPTNQTLVANIVAAGFNADLLSLLTGWTIKANESVRYKKETLTKASDALTLTQTPYNTDAISVKPVAVGGSVAPLLKVSSAPSASGSFQYSSPTTINLHTSQSEDDFEVEYLYKDSSNGETIEADPDLLPAKFGIYAVQPLEDVFDSGSGYLVLEAARAQRISDIQIGGAIAAHTPFEFSANIVNTSPGDVRLYVAKDS